MMNSEEKLTSGAKVPNYAIDEWKKQGKKTVGTICCHVPEEILHAADLLPVRLRGTGCTSDSEAEVWMSSFSCSFVRACLENMLNKTFGFVDGIVSSDGCLMGQRLFDNWNHIDKTMHKQLVVAPRINNEKAVDFYREELVKLKEDMEKLSGVAVTEDKLQYSIKLYNETRKLIQELYDLRKSDAPVITGADSLKITLAGMSMPKEEYNKLLGDFLKSAKSRNPVSGVRARLMIIGSALDDPDFVRIIEEKGGLIVSDVQCFGSRYLWEPVELEEKDALGSLAKSYLGRIVCPRMCDMHQDLFELILKMREEFKADGIVFVKMKNCDTWGGESAYFLDKFKDANIPLLTIEREEIMTNAGQVAIRAEAFIEMIEGDK